jgi:hypothetical protein
MSLRGFASSPCSKLGLSTLIDDLRSGRGRAASQLLLFIGTLTCSLVPREQDPGLACGRLYRPRTLRPPRYRPPASVPAPAAPVERRVRLRPGTRNVPISRLRLRFSASFPRLVPDAIVMISYSGPGLRRIGFGNTLRRCFCRPLSSRSRPCRAIRGENLAGRRRLRLSHCVRRPSRATCSLPLASRPFRVSPLPTTASAWASVRSTAETGLWIVRAHEGRWSRSTCRRPQRNLSGGIFPDTEARASLLAFAGARLNPAPWTYALFYALAESFRHGCPSRGSLWCPRVRARSSSWGTVSLVRAGHHPPSAFAYPVSSQLRPFTVTSRRRARLAIHGRAVRLRLTMPPPRRLKNSHRRKKTTMDQLFSRAEVDAAAPPRATRLAPDATP